MTLLKTLLSTLALGLLLFACSVGTASAATPCWKVLVNDWYDGRIDQTYPIQCYEDALHHLPLETVTYSSARDDIKRAMLAAIRHREPPGGGGRSISGPGANGSGIGPNADSPKGFISRLIDKIGPRNAESVPLPLLVLACIAFLLLAAAAASFMALKIQARRVVVATAPITPPDRR